MIKVNNVSFAFEDKNYLFQNLNFHIGEGETLAILGANGVGKTTLLRCLMRFLKFHTGEMQINDISTCKLNDMEFWKLISYVPQAKHHEFGYSVLNMVVMGRTQYLRFGQMPRKQDYDAAKNVLKDLGLEEFENRSCNTLSGGQLQMVLIARALVKEPKILIMDEPESNLDMKNQLKVLEIIDYLSHKKGLTVIINTHFPAHALRCADKTLLMGKEEYIFAETQKVITSENIEKYFEITSKILDVEVNNKSYSGIIPIGLIV